MMMSDLSVCTYFLRISAEQNSPLQAAAVLEHSSFATPTTTRVPSKSSISFRARLCSATRLSSMSSGDGFASTGAAAPHFALVPYMAAGHAGPMLDMARVLASRGVLVTLVTTPLNLARLGLALGDDALPIRFLQLRFPCVEAGLPEGCETADAIPSLDLVKNFHDACAMLRAPLVEHLAKAEPPATCILSNTCHPWTGSAARELGVPRLAFDCFCAFSSFCMYLMSFLGIFEGVDDDHRPVPVPGFPIDIEMSRARSPDNFTGPGKEFADKVMAENARADGMVLNSFAELEPLFLDAYSAAIGKKIWTVGPLFVATTPLTVTTEDANAVRCSSWLESKMPRSVVFLSFGSLARSSLPQLVEIAHGLEASNRQFLWVVKPDKFDEFDRWLAEDGFESRVGERGLVIRGWAPQTKILAHPATAAFVTHCGWNSVLECVTAGLPMVTWPHFAEQFMNEKLLVDVLRVGVPVGVKDKRQWGVDTEAVAVAATREDVERAVAAVMDDGNEAEARRERAAELAKKAREAVDGGSSYRNVGHLVQHVQEKKFTNQTR